MAENSIDNCQSVVDTQREWQKRSRCPPSLYYRPAGQRGFKDNLTSFYLSHYFKASFDESIEGFGIVADIVLIATFSDIQRCIFPAVAVMCPIPRSFKSCPKSFDSVGVNPSLEDALTSSKYRMLN